MSMIEKYMKQAVKIAEFFTCSGLSQFYCQTNYIVFYQKIANIRHQNSETVHFENEQQHTSNPVRAC